MDNPGPILGRILAVALIVAFVVFVSGEPTLIWCACVIAFLYYLIKIAEYLVILHKEMKTIINQLQDIQESNEKNANIEKELKESIENVKNNAVSE